MRKFLIFFLLFTVLCNIDTQISSFNANTMYILGVASTRAKIPILFIYESVTSFLQSIHCSCKDDESLDCSMLHHLSVYCVWQIHPEQKALLPCITFEIFLVGVNIIRQWPFHHHAAHEPAFLYSHNGTWSHLYDHKKLFCTWVKPEWKTGGSESYHNIKANEVLFLWNVQSSKL
jgi:hypothetical protein